MKEKNTIKIAIVRPPRDVLQFSFLSNRSPLNLMYLKESLVKAGFNVKLIDFEMLPYDENIFLRILKEDEIDIVGFSSFTPTINIAGRIAGRLRQVFPDKLILIGGVHASALPQDTLVEFSGFDIAFIGEGEEGIVKLAKLFQEVKKKDGNRYDFLTELEKSNIAGISFRSTKGEHITQSPKPLGSIDNIPFPSRELDDNYSKSLTHRGLQQKKRKVADILTARGCPFKCSFCAQGLSQNKKFQMRDLINIEEELIYLKNLGYQHINILDSTFNIQFKRAAMISELLYKYGFSWNFNGVINSISDELLDLFKKHNCKGISYGIESGSNDILKKIKKNITSEQIIDAVERTHKKNIPIIEGTFIVGCHQDETEEDFLKTQKLIKRIPLTSLVVSTGTPYPGTEMNRDYKHCGLLEEKEDWSQFLLYGGKTWGTLYLTPKQVQRFQKRALRSFYFRPRQIIKKISGIRSIDEFQIYKDACLSILKRV